MNRQQISIFLAKFWDSFKQKNPEVATILTIIGLCVVVFGMFFEDFGINLPTNVSKFITFISTLFLSFNNPSTYNVLNPSEDENNGE